MQLLRKNTETRTSKVEKGHVQGEDDRGPNQTEPPRLRRGMYKGRMIEAPTKQALQGREGAWDDIRLKRDRPEAVQRTVHDLTT